MHPSIGKLLKERVLMMMPYGLYKVWFSLDTTDRFSLHNLLHFDVDDWSDMWKMSPLGVEKRPINYVQSLKLALGFDLDTNTVGKKRYFRVAAPDAEDRIYAKFTP
jgi:hypothetical protein